MAIKDFYCTLMEQQDVGIKLHDSIKVRAANHSMALDQCITHEIEELAAGKSYQLRVVDGTTGRFIDTYVGQVHK